MSGGLQRRLYQSHFADAVQESVLNLLVAASAVRDRIDVVCAQHGISQQQYNVLRILRGAYPGGHARCEIVRRLIDRASDATRLIDRLEDAGYAVRERSGVDRRLSITRISEEGLALLERMQPDIDRVNAFVAERLDTDDRERLSEICEKLIE